ncbi:MAG: hypothetical protein JKY03_14170 [Aureispira sp.]|nr:hypothetical protein [Aureispira sp.]
MNKTNFKLIAYSIFLIVLSSGLTYWMLSTKVLPPATVQISMPTNNCDIRTWYNFQVLAIPQLNNYWITQEIPLEERAHKAYNLRHNARIHARYMMPSQEEVALLQKRDLAKYGNPDGPTFEDLLQKNKAKGMTLKQTYGYIIQTASKTNNNYNLDCDK